MKKISIIIITTTPKAKAIHLPIWCIRVIIFVISLIICGIGWLVFEYGSIGYKNIKLKLLESENKRLKEENNKITAINYALNEQKEKIIKIANMLGVDNPFEKQNIEIKVDFRPPFIKEGNKEKIILPVDGYIARKFSNEHKAIDISASYGSPVKSIISGVVKFAVEDSILGKMIKIENNEISIIYGHLSKMLVNKGDKVKKGDLVGFVGSSGKSDAPHLHFEVWVNGVQVDPEEYLIR